MPDDNSRDAEEIIILPEKREEILDKLRKVLYKLTTKFETKNGLK